MNKINPSNKLCLRVLNYIHFDHEQYTHIRKAGSGAKKFLEPIFEFFSNHTWENGGFSIDVEGASKITEFLTQTTAGKKDTLEGEPDLIKKVKAIILFLLELFLESIDNQINAGNSVNPIYIEAWDHLHHLLEPYRNVLEGIRKSEYLETLAANGDKDLIKQINVKYRIARIDAAYYIMGLLFPIYPESDVAYRYSDSFRKAMLTDGGIIYNNRPETDQKDSKDFIAFSTLLQKEDPILEVQDILIAVTNYFGGAIQFPEHYDFKEFFLFNGVEMAIPEQAKTIMSFNRAYPIAVIRSKSQNSVSKKEEDPFRMINSKNQDHEFFEVHLEENPWSFTWSVNWPKILEINGSEILNEDETSGEDLPVNAGGSFSKRLTSALRARILEYQESGGVEQVDYMNIEVKIRKVIENCEIIIQLPFMPPRADLLTNIQFDNEESPGIILTCS